MNDNAWLFAGGGLLLLVAGASLVTYRNRQKGAEWERAAYIRGRLDQAEEDVQIAEGARSGNYDDRTDWTEYARGINKAADGIADAIRKGVK